MYDWGMVFQICGYPARWIPLFTRSHSCSPNKKLLLATPDDEQRSCFLGSDVLSDFHQVKRPLGSRNRNGLANVVHLAERFLEIRLVVMIEDILAGCE